MLLIIFCASFLYSVELTNTDPSHCASVHSSTLQTAQSVCEGTTFLFILSETQTVGPPCDDEGALSTMVPVQMSCRYPGGMAIDWSPSPPLFLTKVHFSRDRSKCRHQYCSSLFSPLYTVGAQKLTG